MKQHIKLPTSLIIAFTIIFTFGDFLPVRATDCDSVNTVLNAKFRFLGSWDANGRPLYLDPEGDIVSEEMINYVNETLPETVKVPASNDEYFNDDVQLNTELLEASKVYLTMVHEGAAWTNTLGFYTYSLDTPPQTVYDIDSLVVIFPNVTQPNVINPGDKVLLGDFPAGTGIGYFLIARGWVGDTICLRSHMVFTDKRFNTFTTQAFQQHTILLNYEPEQQILLGFEDQKRPGGDNDFNDAVFYVTADPGAIDTTNIPTIPTAFLSGDTIVCDENAKAMLTVEFKGVAPFSFTYTNGKEEVSLAEINDYVYSFETMMKDTIRISKFNDARKAGIPAGKAVVYFSALSATLSGTELNCEAGSSVVNIELTGTSPWKLEYTFGDEASIIESDQSSLQLPFEEPGTFTLTGVEDLYCQQTLDAAIDVIVPVLPTALISGDTSICEGGEAIISIELTGAAPFTLVYTDGENEIEVTTEESIYEFIASDFNTYTLVRVSDAYCDGSVNGSATVSNLADAINVEIQALETSCDGEEIDLELIGDTGDLTVTWTTEGNGTFSNTDELTTVYAPGENEHGEVVFYAEVTQGCAVKTVSVAVNIIEALDPGFSYSPDQNLSANMTIYFTPNEANYDTYEWDFGDGNTSNATNATHEYAERDIYQVQLTVTLEGCEASGTAELEVLAMDELYIPNAFNPTAINPENQVVKVYGSNVSEEGFAFKIVNRWGKVMYNTNSFYEANNVGWAGVNRNTGVDMELNVFTYIVRGKFNDGKTFEKVGTITLVK